MIIERHDSGSMTINHNDMFFFAHLINKQVYLLIHIKCDGYTYIGKFSDEEHIKEAINIYADQENEMKALD